MILVYYHACIMYDLIGGRLQLVFVIFVNQLGALKA